MTCHIPNSPVWGQLAQLLCAAMMLNVSCMPDVASRNVDSETHFLSACRIDADCAAGFSCLCNVCSAACTDSDSCARISPDAICISADDGFCQASAPRGDFCGIACDETTCPLGLTCRLGQCVGSYECPTGSIVLQPGPDEAKDIWTNNAFSHAGVDGPLQFVGGGLDDDKLEVGGNGDIYLSLLEFDLRDLPPSSLEVTLELFAYTAKGSGTTALYLERITEPWDWRTQGTGADRERLWWADRPDTAQWSGDELPAPIVGEWYSIDITDLYNAWQGGTYPNYGLLLAPVSTDDRWAEFRSGDASEAELRPRLVVSCPIQVDGDE